jgi:hypothetical protein
MRSPCRLTSLMSTPPQAYDPSDENRQLLPESGSALRLPVPTHHPGRVEEMKPPNLHAARLTGSLPMSSNPC